MPFPSVICEGASLPFQSSHSSPRTLSGGIGFPFPVHTGENLLERGGPFNTIRPVRTAAAKACLVLGAGISPSRSVPSSRGSPEPAPTVAALRMVFSALILLPFVLASAGTEGRSRGCRAPISGFSRLRALPRAPFLSVDLLPLVHRRDEQRRVRHDESTLGRAVHDRGSEKEDFAGFLDRSRPLDLGGAIIAGRDAFAGGTRWGGDILALGGAVAIAGYFLVGSRLRGRVPLLAYVFPVYTCAAILLAIAAIVSGAPSRGTDGRPMPCASSWRWSARSSGIRSSTGRSSISKRRSSRSRLSASRSARASRARHPAGAGDPDRDRRRRRDSRRNLSRAAVQPGGVGDEGADTSGG